MMGGLKMKTRTLWLNVVLVIVALLAPVGAPSSAAEAGSPPLQTLAGVSQSATQALTTFDCSTVTEIPKIQCEALVAFYNATDGDNWSDNTDWLVTNTPCSWHGITCAAGNVTNLRLMNHQLSGAIPPEIGNLTALQYLYLWDNQLSGTIPPEIGNLTALKGIMLGSNQLSGTIPSEIGNLTALTVLGLPNNKLSGTIPLEIGNLTKLTQLALHFNQLSGPIPPQIGNLTALTSVMLLVNQLSGPIPPEIGNLTALTSLQLGFNQLSGPIPPEIGNLTALTSLSLYHNQLNGPIPSWIGDLTTLTELLLPNNQLSGPIPPEISNLTALKALWLSHNQLSGAVPSEIGNITPLTHLRIDNNQLSGELPVALTQLTELVEFYFDETYLCVPPIGPIPEWLASIDDMRSTGLVCGSGPTGTLTYIGSSQIGGRSAFFLGEVDRRITLGDHVHLQLPFRNVGNAILTNAVVTITGSLPTFGSVGVKIHNGSSWSSYQQPVTLTPSTLAPGQTGIADFWIYVTNPDPDILQAMPTGTWVRLNDGNNDWTVSIMLEPIAFDIAEHRDMLAGSCLHHPDDPQIQRYAQYAAGAPEAASPPSNSRDPDTTEQAMRNLIARVNEEFLYDRVGRRLWRVPDTVLITEREDYIGQCRHFADLTAGLSRSLGLPTRYIRGNLIQDDWPGAPHMWNEVDTGGGNWQMVDATNNIVFDPFNVHWAWADRYPLSTASILTLHSCNVFCIDNNGCAACRIGFGELFPGELYGLGQGCMDNVKPTHNASLTNQLFNRHPQTDLEIISLDISAPVFVTLGTTFDVVAKATNSTTVTLDNLDIAVSPYLESGWDTPIYAIHPLSHTLSSILPGQAVTVTWVVTPLLAGRPLPLQVAAFSGDLEGVYEQLQNVNEPGTLPNLSLTAGCDQRTVQLGVPITLTAMIADEYLHVITDSLSPISATVYATPTQAFSTTFNLAYCADCQHYTYTLTLPADAPIGRYQVEYTVTRPGYEIEHITSSFFVVPALTMTLVADPLVLNMTDPMTLTAQIYDRGTAISQAGVYAEITTPSGVTAIPLFSSEGAVYTATLRPADLADSLGAPLLPGQWTIKAIGNYQGGMATAMQSITIRHNIYLPLILRNY